MMFRNAEHYADPTAGKALQNIENEENKQAMERIKPMMRVMHELAKAFGFEIAERIVFRDLNTRREYR